MTGEYGLNSFYLPRDFYFRGNIDVYYKNVNL